MNVEHILKIKGRNVVTAGTDASVGAVIALMVSNGIGAVIVTDDAGRVAGIVSERDVVVCLAKSQRDLANAPVSELMTRKVVSCRLGNSVDELMRTMTDRRIRHLPVIEDDRLIGVISIGDVVKFRVDELESETRQLKDYIERG